MVFGKLFKKAESLLSIDIGSTSVKLLELDMSGGRPRLVNAAIAPVRADIFSNNVLSKGEDVSEILHTLMEENGVEDRRAVVAMPSPSVFTKRIKMSRMSLEELTDNVQLEAGNFIPHNIDAVKVDYHILGEAGRNQLDILVVAVKNDIVESFVDCLAMAGLETAVVDVDYFALQNMYEMAAPDLVDKTVALVNIGARYSSINICRGGSSLFTGDMSLGGKFVTEALVQELGVSVEEAEQLKARKGSNAAKAQSAADVIERSVEFIASEFNRQLSFFWSASGAEDGIDKILLCGGGALIPGLVEDLTEKTGVSCELLDPLKGIEIGPQFDKTYIKEIAPLLGVAAGMGIRQQGDRIVPDDLE